MPQCRANVPGWFGLAEALAEIGTELAPQMYRDWPYFRAMLDNAQLALGKSEMAIFAHYLTLAPTQRCGQVVLDAFSRTIAAVRSGTGVRDEALERALVLSLHGIAAGMQNAG